jgi:hypothetical protein
VKQAVADTKREFSSFKVHYRPYLTHNPNHPFPSPVCFTGACLGAKLARLMCVVQVGVAMLPTHKLRYSAPGHVAVSYDVYQWLAGPGSQTDVVYFTDWQVRKSTPCARVGQEREGSGSGYWVWRQSHN